MCRNIKTLHHFEPPATDDEIRASVLQYVRKLSGYRAPSKENEDVFNAACEEIYEATRRMLDGLVGRGEPRNREEWAAKKRERFERRNRA